MSYLMDLTAVIAGPYCSQFLGDFGADVIKVEKPEGDLTRNVGAQRNPNMSANFLIFNRNKRSVVLDLKQKEGREALLRLAATCDAVVTNFRPAALRKLGIAFKDIKSVNEAIVYCQIVGFGEDHPSHDRPGIDDVIQSMTGIVSLQGELTGEPGYVALPLADLTCALFAVSGIMAALYRKRDTGQGGEVEIRMYDVMASFNLSPHLSGWSFEPPISPPIYQRSVAKNRRPFRTRDGSICLAPYTDRVWRRFLALIDRTELLNEPRFASTYERSKHLDELYAIMVPIVASRSTAEWMDLLVANDIPASPVQSTMDLVRDPTLRSAGVLGVYTHPTEGQVRLMSSPIRFSGSAGGITRMPPTLGQHSFEVLGELGYSQRELKEMAGHGVTVAPSATDSNDGP